VSIFVGTILGITPISFSCFAPFSRYFEWLYFDHGLPGSFTSWCFMSCRSRGVPSKTILYDEYEIIYTLLVNAGYVGSAVDLDPKSHSVNMHVISC
jgi:hypothetical protein